MYLEEYVKFILKSIFISNRNKSISNIISVKYRSIHRVSIYMCTCLALLMGINRLTKYTVLLADIKNVIWSELL